MPCEFACVVFLGNVFSLVGSASGQLDASYFPDYDYAISRATLSPAVTFSQKSARGSFVLGYAPSFTRALFQTDADVHGAQSVTLAHRLTLNWERAITKTTSVSATVSGVTGTFDLAGLTSQLGAPNGGTPPGANGTAAPAAGDTAVPVTGATTSVPGGTATGTTTTGTSTTATGAELTAGTTSYRNLNATLGAATSLSARWRLTTSADGAYAESNQNAVLGGVPQSQFGVTTGLGYALSSHLVLQGTALGRYTYARPGHGPLLGAGGMLGTGIQLSRTTGIGLNLGYVYSGPWFGVERIPGTNGSGSGVAAGGSFSQVLSQGNNAFAYNVGVGWQPTYDPISGRVIGRATLNAALTWRPGRDWNTGLNATLLTSTTRKPQVVASPAGDLGVGTPSPETRVSASLPVSYALAHWASLTFGANAFFSAPHFAAPFHVLLPSYSAFVGAQVRVP